MSHGKWPAEDHTNQSEQTRRLLKRLVQTNSAISIVLELSDTISICQIVGVHDPVLRSAPISLKREVKHYNDDESGHNEEEQVELLCTTAAHTEANIKRVLLQFDIKRKHCNKVEEAHDLSNHDLVDVIQAIEDGEEVYIDPAAEQDGDEDQINPDSWLAVVLEAEHNDNVGPEECHEKASLGRPSEAKKTNRVAGDRR